MTKQKTAETEAEKPPVTTTEGQDTVQATEATTEGPGADATPVNDPDGNPPSIEAPADPGPNLATLNHLIQQVGMLNHTGLRAGLVGDLRDFYGAEIVETDGEGVTISIEGVSIDPADCLENALTNWANAARRAIAGATA